MPSGSARHILVRRLHQFVKALSMHLRRRTVSFIAAANGPGVDKQSDRLMKRNDRGRLREAFFGASIGFDADTVAAEAVPLKMRRSTEAERCHAHAAATRAFGADDVGCDFAH